MEIYNTNEIRGDRFVYVRPGEDHPEYGAVVLKYETDEEGKLYHAGYRTHGRHCDSSYGIE